MVNEMRVGEEAAPPPCFRTRNWGVTLPPKTGPREGEGRMKDLLLDSAAESEEKKASFSLESGSLLSAAMREPLKEGLQGANFKNSASTSFPEVGQMPVLRESRRVALVAKLETFRPKKPKNLLLLKLLLWLISALCGALLSLYLRTQE